MANAAKQAAAVNAPCPNPRKNNVMNDNMAAPSLRGQDYPVLAQSPIAAAR